MSFPLPSGEVQALRRELQVLSVQHGQKCLENSQLNQQLQDQRQALQECQNQIQELKKKQVSLFSLSKRRFLTALRLNSSLLFKRDEISEAQLSNGKQPHISPYTTDQYEMEVSLNTSTHL